jgi:cytochrome c peroxidase
VRAALRNIALTAPYMHDGSLATLEEVIDHYATGGKLDHLNKSRILRPLPMTDGDKRDLIEFLKSLTDEELLHVSNPVARGEEPERRNPERRNSVESSPFGASLPST